MKPQLVDIEPPPYKTPVQMLRNLADDIEQGDYGEIGTIVIATFGDTGLEMFGGGRDSGREHCVFVLGAAQHRLLATPSS